WTAPNHLEIPESCRSGASAMRLVPSHCGLLVLRHPTHGAGWSVGGSVRRGGPTRNPLSVAVLGVIAHADVVPGGQPVGDHRLFDVVGPHDDGIDHHRRDGATLVVDL